MRNSAAAVVSAASAVVLRLPSKSDVVDARDQLRDRIGDISGLDPKTVFSGRGPPHTLIQDDEETESVAAKWEHLQYLENNRSSISSSSSASSTSYSSSLSRDRHTPAGFGSGSGSGLDSAKDKLQRMRKAGWKKIKKQFAFVGGGGGGREGVSSKKEVDRRFNGGLNYGDVVSTVPGGGGGSAGGGIGGIGDAARAAAAGVLPRIRSSRSMQNLDKMTRDSYFNFRDATSSMKQKYHSRLELRQQQAKPKAADYNEFMDEESDDLDADCANSMLVNDSWVHREWGGEWGAKQM